MIFLLRSDITAFLQYFLMHVRSFPWKLADNISLLILCFLHSQTLLISINHSVSLFEKNYLVEKNQRINTCIVVACQFT